jgi:hypothetical protein
MFLVVFSYAKTNRDAVIVFAHDACTTAGTVTGSRRLHFLANVTKRWHLVQIDVLPS